MRHWMLLGPETPPEVKQAHALEPPKLMLAVGGMEGVIDEAAVFLEQRSKWGVSPPPPIYAIASGGGAAARLVKSNPAVRALEQEWRREYPDVAPEDSPFEPYAVMTQWVIDRI
jgi:hypothetical protein